MKKKKVSKGLTPNQVKLIFSLTKKGLSQREVAKKVKCSGSAVYYHIHK